MSFSKLTLMSFLSLWGKAACPWAASMIIRGLCWADSASVDDGTVVVKSCIRWWRQRQRLKKTSEMAANPRGPQNQYTQQERRNKKIFLEQHMRFGFLKWNCSHYFGIAQIESFFSIWGFIQMDIRYNFLTTCCVGKHWCTHTPVLEAWWETLNKI